MSILAKIQLPTMRTGTTRGGSDRQGRDGRSPTAWLTATLCFIAISTLYVWLWSAGRMTQWEVYSRFYDWLADAFLAGRAHLLIQPPPALLALKDPFDPLANRPAGALADALLYDGKYYVYWGPVPALIVSAIRACGVPASATDDSALTLGFCIGTLGVSFALLTLLWRRVFGSLPIWTLILGLAGVGLSPMLTFLLGRGAVYEAAISAGQLFLIAGIAVLYASSDELSTPWRLLGAGLCFALAVASRFSLAPAVVAVGVLAALRSAATRKEQMRNLAYALVPVAVSCAALGVYNDVRFGSPFDFGQRYQLCAYNTRLYFAQHGSNFSAHYLLSNALLYIFRPLRLTSAFPFVVCMPPGSHALPSWLPMLPPFARDEVAGLPVIAPFTLFALFWPALRRRSKELAAGMVRLIDSLAAAAAINFAVLLGYAYLAQRYESDYGILASIMASAAFWQGWRAAEGSRIRQALLLALATACIAWTASTAMLTPIVGRNNHFLRSNPALFVQLAHICHASDAVVVGGRNP